METTASAPHFDQSDADDAPTTSTFDELQSGPFITVVSVDGGSFCGNKLTVITPQENDGKQFNGENDNGGLENGHHNTWLRANGRDSNNNENELNNENLNLASSEGESGSIVKSEEDDFNCGGAAYVTVLALGKNQHDNEISHSPNSNITHGNGNLEKKSIVNIFNTDDEATLFPGYNGPQAQAHIAHPEVESIGLRIGHEGKDNGIENGCGKEKDDEEQAPSRPPPPLPQSPSPFPFRRRQKSIVSIEESPEIVENVTVYRLPGERLGFGLRFEGIGVSNPLEKVEHVFIQSCADESPAQRTLTSWGHLVEGDEILEIEHTSVTEMTRSDCVSALKDASVAVHLLIRHLSNTNEVKLHTTAKVVISNELTPVSHYDNNISTTPLYNDNEQMLDDRGFKSSDSMFGDYDIGGGPHQDADFYEPDECGRGCNEMENRVLYGEGGRMNRSIDTPSRLSPRKLNVRSRSGTPPLLLPLRSSNSRKSHAHHLRLVRSKSVGYNNYTAMGYEHGAKPEAWTGFGRDQRHTQRAKSSSSFYPSKSTPSSPAPFYPPTTFHCHYNANGLVELVPQTMNHLNDRERFTLNESLSTCEYRPSSMEHYNNGYNNVNINNDGLGSDYYDDYGTASSTRSTVVSRLSLASTATVFSEFQQIHATITDHAPNMDNKPQQCNGHHTNAALEQMELEGTPFCSSINNSNNKRQVTLNHADEISAKEPACAESCSANEVPLTPPLYFQDNIAQSIHLQHTETQMQIEEGGAREGAAISQSYNKGHCQSHSDNNELNLMVFNRIKSMNMVQVLEDMNKFNVFTNANNNRLCEENGHNSTSRPHSARSNHSQYQYQHALLPRDTDAVLEQFFPGDDEEEDELSMFTEELGGYGPDGEPRQWIDNREEFDKILSRNETMPKDGPEVTIRIEWLHDIEEVRNSDSQELAANDEKTDVRDAGQAVDETSTEFVEPKFQEAVTIEGEIVPERDVVTADVVAYLADSEIKPLGEGEKPDTSAPDDQEPSMPTPKRRKRNKENSTPQQEHKRNHHIQENGNLTYEGVITDKIEVTNGTDCNSNANKGTDYQYDDLIVSSPSLTPTIPHKYKSHSEEEKTRGGELSRCIQYVNPTAMGLNSVPLFLLTHENVIEEQNEEDDALESSKLIYSSTKEIIINRIPDYESVESTNVFETMTVTSKKRELILEEVVPIDCSYEHVEYASNDLHDQQIYEFKTFGKSNSGTDASSDQIGVNQTREKAELSQTDDNSNQKAIKESPNDNAEIDSICASESVKPPIIVKRENKPKHQESGLNSTELNEAVKEQIPKHAGPEIQDKSDLVQGETQSAKDNLVQEEQAKNVTRDKKDEIKMTNQMLVVRPRPVATIHMSKIPRPAFSNAVQPPLVSKMTPSMTLIPRMVTSLAMTSDSKGESNGKPKASGLPGLLSRITKPGIKLVRENNFPAKKPQTPSPLPAPSPTPSASPSVPPPASVEKDEPPPPTPRSPLKSILKHPSTKASAVEENVLAEVPDPVLKGDSKGNSTNATETNPEAVEMENSVLNSFDPHTQVHFEQPSLAPRLPPDGHEFPNTWLDESIGDTNESLKPYRSSDFSASKTNGSDLNWARPDSPPPPPPRTEPPLLDEDSSAYPQIPSPPPPVTSRVRKNSVEERKRLFELSSAAQVNDKMEASAPIVPPKTTEPSRRSVKDKIAMFSSAAGDGAPASTANSSMSSSLSFPSANTNGYSKMSKSTDHLPGISSGNLQLYCETTDTQSKSDARQVSAHDQHDSLRSVKPMGERSQSLLNIGNSQNPNASAVIEERRRGTMSKLRGLVIPDKNGIAQNSISVMDLPTIYSKDVSPVKSVNTPSLPVAKQQPPVPPVPAARKHNLSRTESLDGVSPSSDGYNRNHKLVSKPSVPPPGPPSSGLSDWKVATSLPKYSPAFKRRSFTAYQTAITSPTMKPQLSTNFKATTSTPEPKSLESCTSPRSDSSFEYASPTSDKPKIVGITTVTSVQRNHAASDNNAVNKQEQKVTFDPNQRSGTKDSPKRTRSGKIVEDSDTDSAVSSSRSSISHELSPPNSPLPSKENQTTQRTENSTSGQQRYTGQEVVDGTSTTEDSANNSDEGWRILKPQSVEAINRKNVLTSAKFSNGTYTSDSLPTSGGEVQNGRTIYNNHDHHIRRSDDEEAGYADGETEDTESSCSELDTGKSRRHSGQMAHHHTQHMSLAKRPITDTEDDDDDYEENLQTSNLNSNTVSEEKHVHQTPAYPEKQIVTAVKAINEDPLQAIYDMEVKMAYVNEICDSLPSTRIQQPDHRFFSRRESEATVIEYPIERKSSTSSSTVTVTSEQDLRKGKSISSTSSIDDVDSNTNDQPNSFSVARKHSLPNTGPITSTPNQAASSSRRNSVDDANATPSPATKSPSLDKKYSTSMTSVNLLSSVKKQESPIDTSRPTLVTAVSTNSLVEKKMEKFIEAAGTASPNKPSPVTGKSKFTSTNIPRGRNDFKSLSEKWQQISSSSNSAAVSVLVPANNVSTEAKVVTPAPSIQPSYNGYSFKSDQEESTPASRLRVRGGVGESREREREERKPWIAPRRLDTASPTVPTTTSSSTKRSVSVNDIRKAFEKAEMAVNTYGRDDNSSDNLFPNKKIQSGKETDSSSILSPPSAHFRVSSFDSTTSEDSSANTPAGIYGSVSNLVSSSSSAQKDPYGSITSLASSTSLISPQELQQLIDEANQSLEEAGTPSHEVSVVILHREFAGGSLGITLAGGADYETKEITVHKVLTGSIADRDGRIHRGDRVLSINGKSTKGCTHRDALNLLKAPRTEVVLVVSRGRSTSNGFQTIEETTATLDRAVEPLLNGSLASLLENDEDAKYNWGPMRTVILNKDGAGLGFSLEGGQGSITGDKPLTIKKIFVGGPAEKSGALKVGDLIISINNVNMSTKSRTEAWNFMKKLCDGEVKLMVKSPM